jgi:hypothetical protein
MKSKEVIQYECDFCSKKLLHKGYMKRHENECNSNPQNKRPCYDCVNLGRKEIEYDTGITNYQDGKSIFREVETFYCKVKDMLLISPKVRAVNSRKKSNIEFVYIGDKEVQQFDMPKECKEQKELSRSISDPFEWEI